jgi:hypothetical protein
VTTASLQLSVVEDEVTTNLARALNETDKKDIKLILDRILTGISNWHS